MDKFGPRRLDSTVACPACGLKIIQGQYSALISLGPGADEDEQKRCREGRPYNAVAVEVHWSCATGEAS